MIIASEAAAKANGLTPRARILAAVSAGVPPRVMGIGPVPATRKLLAKLGMTAKDFDTIELNEAFAAQALAVLRQLGLADDAGEREPERRRDRARPSARRLGRPADDHRAQPARGAPAASAPSAPCASASARASRWRWSGSSSWTAGCTGSRQHPTPPPPPLNAGCPAVNAAYHADRYRQRVAGCWTTLVDRSQSVSDES